MHRIVYPSVRMAGVTKILEIVRVFLINIGMNQQKNASHVEAGAKAVLILTNVRCVSNQITGDPFVNTTALVVVAYATRLMDVVKAVMMNIIKL